MSRLLTPQFQPEINGIVFVKIDEIKKVEGEKQKDQSERDEQGLVRKIS